MSSSQAIFERARQLPHSQLAAFLDEQCGNNLVLRAEVEKLLAIDVTGDISLGKETDEQESLLTEFDEPISEVTATASVTPPTESTNTDQTPIAGAIIAGRYKLLQRLGEGGMGEVWMAEQSEPVKRRVALKLIKKGLGSKEVMVRFAAERQAVALMNHPNIARFLDAGTTADGQPYYVMELVTGKPLTTYCDENRLSIEERLELFADVCGGVQHAHQKGIIHRDLKPSNILVAVIDGKSIPKVIDFGLAKAMESTQRLTDQSLFTGIGQILGTFKYMSPEQANLDSIDIDTRTDIYALGVILYELLTGSTPLDDSSIKGQAVWKILEVIRDKEPVKPSSKLGSSTDKQVSTITVQRKTESARLKRILLGDLDWIVMKALEKDRTRRYESASGFAADIRRYLNSEPADARPPSLNYRVRKFVQKNRVVVIAASLVVLALLGGTVGTTLSLLRANKYISARSERAKSEEELQVLRYDFRDEERRRKFAETINEFFRNDFLTLITAEIQNPFREETSGGFDRNTTLFQLLERAAEKLILRSDLDPLIEAELCFIVGENFRIVGAYDRALTFLERTVEIRRKFLGPADEKTLEARNSLAVTYNSAGQLAQAFSLFEETLQSIKAKLCPDHPFRLTSMNNLAVGYWTAKRLELSVPLFEELLELRGRKLGRSHLETQLTVANLGVNYKDADRVDEAIPLLEEAHESSKHMPQLAWVKDELRDAYIKGKRIEQFDAMAKTERVTARETLRKGSLELAGAMVSIGSDYLTVGDAAQAEELLTEGLRIRQNLAPDAWKTFTTQSLLGGALLAQAISQTDKAKKADLLAKAQPLLTQGYEGMKQRKSTIPAPSADAIPEALDRLIELYTVLDQPEQTAKYQQLRNEFSDNAGPEGK
jgi:eukaryotic-like serine/threonine-protein kinase